MSLTAPKSNELWRFTHLENLLRGEVRLKIREVREQKDPGLVPLWDRLSGLPAEAGGCREGRGFRSRTRLFGLALGRLLLVFGLHVVFGLAA